MGEKLKPYTCKERLQQIMDERNMRQVDIVRACEPYCKKYDVRIEKPDISQYMRDKYEPAQDKIAILAMGLNVSESWLMGFDVPRTRISSDAGYGIDDDCLEAARMYAQLDEVDKARIKERMEAMLEAEKYREDSFSKGTEI